MNRIKKILEVKGMSQTDLAHRLGKSFNTVNLYAANKVQPPLPVFIPNSRYPESGCERFVDTQ